MELVNLGVPGIWIEQLAQLRRDIPSPQLPPSRTLAVVIERQFDVGGAVLILSSRPLLMVDVHSWVVTRLLRRRFVLV